MDVVYRSVLTLSPIAQKVALSRVVQRLKHISQLGFGLPFCSRYEHSLGVAYLSRVAGETLAEGDSSVTDQDILRLELAGLLHDCGHGPFSHTFDKHFLSSYDRVRNRDHEDRSVQLVPIAFSNIAELDELDVSWVQHMIRPSKIPCPEISKAFLGTIVCNTYHGMDTDKLDYLGRDVMHLARRGFVPDHFCDPHVINPLPIIKSIRASPRQILFSLKHKGWLHEKSELRRWMYENVYLHPDVVRAQLEGITILQPFRPLLLRSVDNMELFVEFQDDSFGPLPPVLKTLSPVQKQDEAEITQKPEDILPLVPYW